MNPQRFLALAVVATWLIISLGGCKTHPLDQAMQQVPIGMPREEAIKILRSQSWYHQPCKNFRSIDDLFFYGSHRYDQADVVIVTSVPEGSDYRVTDLGTFFEPNAWHAAYADCIQRGAFEP